MKDPCAYAAAQRIMNEIKVARSFYLGSSVDERLPSHRVTIMFNREDTAKVSEEAQVESICEHVANALEGLAAFPLLHVDPTIFDTKNRLRECRECGSMHGATHL